DGAPITKMLIGTSLHGNDVAVITGPPWSFGAEAGKRYYATIAPVTVTVTSEEGGSFGYTMNDGVTWTPFIIDPLDSYEITDIPSGTHISIRAETDTGFIAVWEDTDGNITIGTVLSFTAVSDTEIAVTATPFTIGVPEPPDDPSGDTPGPPGVRISSDGSSVKLYLPFIILVIAILVLTEVLLHTRKRK
ncbi:MAG: hypothetical protein FWH44_03870, partial [Methanomassiliicoccaceae archaeon]|nr:hypothetical protein [Methanomassiliicoccaceae archaeon]